MRELLLLLAPFFAQPVPQPKEVEVRVVIVVTSPVAVGQRDDSIGYNVPACDIIRRPR